MLVLTLTLISASISSMQAMTPAFMGRVLRALSPAIRNGVAIPSTGTRTIKMPWQVHPAIAVAVLRALEYGEQNSDVNRDLADCDYAGLDALLSPEK